MCNNIKKRIDSEEMGDLVFEVLVPTERVSEIKRGRKTETTRKFYPGYIIVNMHLLDEEGSVAIVAAVILSEASSADSDLVRRVWHDLVAG